MIKFDIEKYSQWGEDIKELTKLHYDEVAVNKDVIPLDPDWDRYKYLCDNNLLLCITARDEKKLVGYSIFFITKHIHYKSTTYATNDVLYLHPNYRKGSLGLKLIKISEKFLKEINADKILWHIKFNKDFRSILHRLGYVDEDVIVGKIIKD